MPQRLLRRGGDTSPLARLTHVGPGGAKAPLFGEKRDFVGLLKLENADIYNGHIMPGMGH